MTAPNPANMPRHEHTFVPGVFFVTENRDFKRALNEWRQGDILTGIGLFWAAPDGTDILTGLEHARDSSTHPLPVYQWDGQPADESLQLEPPDWLGAMSIVTSQTCDIAPAGPGQRHPTVQVSPLERYDHLEQSVQKSIERGEYVDAFAVPGAPGTGKWMANLRISLPVSKSVLAGQTPVHGFTGEAGELEFSERVGSKFRRPALHDALSADMTNSLRQLIVEAREAGEDWPEMVEQFRLEIVEGTRLKPTRVRVLAVTLNKFDRGERSPLRSWRSKQDKALKRAHEISLAPVRFATLTELSVNDYRHAVQLRVPELGQSLMYY